MYLCDNIITVFSVFVFPYDLRNSPSVHQTMNPSVSFYWGKLKSLTKMISYQKKKKKANQIKYEVWILSRKVGRRLRTRNVTTVIIVAFEIFYDNVLYRPTQVAYPRRLVRLWFEGASSDM